ncbi:hypothetical protein ASZ90_009836 [hydrocarbon metagenome]|uniref:Uncharacterized protein n=1 Tax=hydrocarbon metagenome TaxID=938273 RepID=A0A0W8FHR5_9ZZZZ
MYGSAKNQSAGGSHFINGSHFYVKFFGRTRHLPAPAGRRRESAVYAFQSPFRHIRERPIGRRRTANHEQHLRYTAGWIRLLYRDVRALPPIRSGSRLRR